MGHVVDGSGVEIFTSQAWSVLPRAEAVRGSGPGQQPAFDDAMARVGCPSYVDR